MTMGKKTLIQAHIFTLTAVLGLTPTLVAQPLAEPAGELFPRPESLEPAVEFWKSVYATWTRDDVIFHDRDDLGIVYHTMYQVKSETPSEYRANDAVQKEIIARYRRILLDLADSNPDPRTLSGDYKHVYELFGESGSPQRWREAADRIRIQRGLRKRFKEGLVIAGRYRRHILEALRQEGVPDEIAWLPMVESSFNMQARSAVGAAGVWQFMPATGRKYMRVDRTVDERYDPIIAAHAAAKHLRRNYNGLGSWPLALTAYNHGYYGMRRAVKQLGTNDYMTIRENYQGRAFKFASKNFYPEFLAAVEVAENAQAYFGDFVVKPTLAFDEVVIPTRFLLQEIATALQIEAELLWQLNPSLTSRVWRGERTVPAEFELRIPVGQAEAAHVQLAAAAAGKSGRRTRGEVEYYTVQRGDTLSAIAARHGVSVNDLVDLNDLDNEDRIRVGQRLKISG